MTKYVCTLVVVALFCAIQTSQAQEVSRRRPATMTLHTDVDAALMDTFKRYLASPPQTSTRELPAHVDKENALALAAKIVAAAYFFPPTTPADLPSVRLWSGKYNLGHFCEGCVNANTYPFAWERPWISLSIYSDAIIAPERAIAFGAYAASVEATVGRSFTDKSPFSGLYAPSNTEHERLLTTLREGVRRAGLDDVFKRLVPEEQVTDATISIASISAALTERIRPEDFPFIIVRTILAQCGHAFARRNDATIQLLARRIRSTSLPSTKPTNNDDKDTLVLISAKELSTFLKTHPVRAPRPSDFSDPRAFAFCTAPSKK